MRGFLKEEIEGIWGMNELPCDICKGKCCGPLPMLEGQFNEFKKRVRIPSGTKILRTSNSMSSKGVVLVAANGSCPFLKKGKCSIYLLRPKICRDYGKIKELPCAYLYPDKKRD